MSEQEKIRAFINKPTAKLDDEMKVIFHKGLQIATDEHLMEVAENSAGILQPLEETYPIACVIRELCTRFSNLKEQHAECIEQTSH